MPIFDMYCLECEKAHEVIIPLKSHGKKVPCPKCQKPLKKHFGKINLSSKRVTLGY